MAKASSVPPANHLEIMAFWMTFNDSAPHPKMTANDGDDVARSRRQDSDQLRAESNAAGSDEAQRDKDETC